jgi:hypothetical protein
MIGRQAECVGTSSVRDSTNVYTKRENLAECTESKNMMSVSHQDQSIIILFRIYVQGRDPGWRDGDADLDQPSRSKKLDDVLLETFVPEGEKRPDRFTDINQRLLSATNGGFCYR